MLRDQRGATAIEFAIVIGPFILLIGGIIEVGIMLFAEYTLQNSVQEAARRIQIGQTTTVAGAELTGAAQFKTLICDKAPILRDCTTKIGIYVNNAANFTQLAAATPAASTILPEASTPFNTGAGFRAVVVMATYDWSFTFPFMRIFNNVGGLGGVRRVQGVAVFLNEAFDQ